MENKYNIAIITARGGSKRIPRKNIKLFCGEPIISYSIRAAQESGCFDTIMVSTDDDEIAAISIALGTDVPFRRSASTSNDKATTSDVLKEVLLEYEKLGTSFKLACCIYPTAPFLTAERLSESFRLLESTGADTVLPVVRYSFPPQRSMRIVDGALEMLYPEHLNSRSQDLEAIYHDCGQFYTFKTHSFLASGRIVNGKVVPLEIDEMEAQDIDNETDWRLAELKYKLLHGIDRS